MADEYRDLVDAIVGDAAAFDLTCDVIDVHDAFDRLPERGDPFIGAVEETFFSGHRRERYREVTNPGLNRTDNHLQGLQRYRGRIYLSAGDLMEGRAHLFVLKEEPGADAGGVAARLTRIISLDDRRDHGGGMQRLGDVLAIAIEGDRIGSTVEFLHLADPDHPRRIEGARIEREEQKASAAAITRLSGDDGDRILVGVTWFKGGPLLGLLGGSRAYLDLYLSRSDDPRHGFLDDVVRIDVSRLADKAPPWQAIAFLPHDAGDIMLIGTRSTKSAPGGRAHADLCRLRFDGDATAAWPDVRVAAEHIRTRTFAFDRDFGDFAAAAGLEYDPVHGLVLYAAAHYRFTDGFRLSVCRPQASIV
jgi:hypothetical protein